MEKKKDVLTLRDVLSVSKDKFWVQRFEEAERLARGIFEEDKTNIPLPYFTDHGVEHCKGIEAKAKRRRYKRKPKMRVSGKQVFGLNKAINKRK